MDPGWRGLPLPLVLSLSPMGFVLLGGTFFSDPLFLGLAVAASAAFERERRGLSTALLVGATATRLVGVGLVLGLAFRELERNDVVRVSWAERRLPVVHLDRTRFRLSQLQPLLGMFGALSYFAYCGVVHGEPFAYFRIQNWLTPSPPRTNPAAWVHWGMFTNFGKLIGTPGYLAFALLGALLTIMVAYSVPAVVRRYGLGYGLFTVVVVGLIWLGAYDFASANRYLLAAFPTAAVVGERLARHRGRSVAAIAVAGPLMIGLSVVFHSGHLLAW